MLAHSRCSNTCWFLYAHYKQCITMASCFTQLQVFSSAQYWITELAKPAKCCLLLSFVDIFKFSSEVNKCKVDVLMFSLQCKLCEDRDFCCLFSAVFMHTVYSYMWFIMLISELWPKFSIVAWQQDVAVLSDLLIFSIGTTFYVFLR